MNFFEDLSKTLSGKGKEAVNKAKELTDVIKLKTQLANEKSKLNEIFQVIGCKYYEQWKDGEFEEAFRAEMMAVKKSKARMAALEKEICDMEGTRSCPACGAKLSQEDAFCSKCGAKMPEKPVEPEEDDLFEDDDDLEEELEKDDDDDDEDDKEAAVITESDFIEETEVAEKAEVVEKVEVVEKAEVAEASVVEEIQPELQSEEAQEVSEPAEKSE